MPNHIEYITNKQYFRKYNQNYYKKHRKNIIKKVSLYQKTDIGKEIHKKANLKYSLSHNGKRHIRLKAKKYYFKYPKKIKARERLHYLFRKKYLYNFEFICAICAKQPIEKHHENYDLPYVFIPLCKEHHSMATNNKKVI